MPQSGEVIIIGAGLTGLCAAYYFKKRGVNARILEARDRIGGRILTVRDEQGTAIEMGATWLGNKHQHLTNLLKELKIGVFEQYLGPTAIYEPISTSPPQLAQLPDNPDPSYRIERGSSKMIACLAGKLGSDQIILDQVVKTVRWEGHQFELKTQDAVYKANYVLSTLPPRLLVQSIDWEPALPASLMEIATQTHTWMGESIKVGFSFKAPFWKKGGTSGTMFSNVGPVSELYDHTNVAETHFALKGFLNGAYHSAGKAKRKELILNQLSRYYGEAVAHFQSYQELVWSKEPFTYVPYEAYILPHQNNGHTIFRQPYFDGRLWIGGSETAAAYPGYMDGAVQSARWMVDQVLA